MKKVFALLVLAVVSMSLGGCVTAIALKEERRKVNELPVVTYNLSQDNIACSSVGAYVNDYVVKDLSVGSKIHLRELDVACFVREAFAKRTAVGADPQEAIKSVTILNAEAEAQFSTFWNGPWANVVISAEVYGKNGSKRTASGTGTCHMLSDDIGVFSKEQIMRIIRNASEALVSAITDIRSNVEIGQNMDCLPDGHVIIK
jgi:hypothetical protein